MSRSLGEAPARANTRWDIQALRAFAVLSVVGYHLWPLRLPGGFVGVDVFFVISGYLITSHLLREITSTGRIALGSFWARRAKRLLPAAFTAIVAIGIAVLLVAPISVWGQYGRELIASTVYVQNWQLASDSVNYLAVGNLASPFQHFWSLSTEEQFYIGLPILLALVLLIARLGRSWRPVVLIRVLLVVVIALSFAWCVIQTHSAPGIAYFSTATRAWEFALGGLVSTFAVAPLTERGRTAAATGTWVGVGLLFSSLWVITPTTAFPGYAAALPVIGAALVVTLGGHSDLAVIGRIRPLEFVGRISYSLYLWHWPPVVLLPMWLGHPLTTKDKIAVVIASLVVASASTLLIEEPLRFARWIRTARPRRIALLGAIASIVVIGLGAGTLSGLQIQQAHAEAQTKQILAHPPRCFGAAAAISSPTPCVNRALDDVRVPGPADVSTDDANRPECWASGTADFHVCQLGPKTGYTKHLLAIGDSHNNVYVRAYEEIADQNNWRIDVAGHISCYWTEAEQAAASAELQQQCDGWKQNANTYITAQKDLSAVVVTHSTTNSPVLAATGKSTNTTIVDGLVDAWRHATANGVPIIAIADNPHGRADVVQCVSLMRGKTTSECDRSKNKALGYFDGQREALAAIGGNGRIIDMSDLMCVGDVCKAVIGGAVVYRDPTHMTATFVDTMVPYLSERFQKVLSQLGR